MALPGAARHIPFVLFKPLAILTGLSFRQSTRRNWLSEQELKFVVPLFPGFLAQEAPILQCDFAQSMASATRSLPATYPAEHKYSSCLCQVEATNLAQAGTAHARASVVDASLAQVKAGVRTGDVLVMIDQASARSTSTGPVPL